MPKVVDGNLRTDGARGGTLSSFVAASSGSSSSTAAWAATTVWTSHTSPLRPRMARGFDFAGWLVGPFMIAVGPAATELRVKEAGGGASNFKVVSTMGPSR
eukprot:CAMPEP_0177505760 /NCGR_PEP_ID=MMETSP0369-20130122/39582_1 /TAXON_ID=447022 ORGANISM="Scrippsiella hangoei-like, Strain SHHI-4" /NCGR_SAMPLE_ID=MMETSP0369 /ASSEMBLY_ACC=CAM_ASM_000364 /LENGTH=100 /DNA_ID=CAMNT_0018983659 /DNA_START=256 /DNA_END=558 /DNA_ORIENTATION=-